MGTRSTQPRQPRSGCQIKHTKRCANLVRARADAKTDELRAKHRLSKFLLRQGVHPPAGVRTWSERDHQWLDQVHFEQLPDWVVLADYLTEVRAAGDQVKRLEAALHECAETTTQRQLIRALQAIRGIGFLTAVTIVAEAVRLASLRQRTAMHGLRRSGCERALERQQSPSRLDHQDRQQLAAARAGRGGPSRLACGVCWGSAQAAASHIAAAGDRVGLAGTAAAACTLWAAGRIGTHKAVTAIAREWLA